MPYLWKVRTGHYYILCNNHLVIMDSLIFLLSGKHYISPSSLNDSFAVYSNLACRSLLPMTLNISCQSPLACKVSFEISADSLLRTPPQVPNCFSLAAFNILSLSLTFGILIMMCLGVDLFASILTGTLCDSWPACLFPSANQGSFLSLFFQIDFQFLALFLLLLATL